MTLKGNHRLRQHDWRLRQRPIAAFLLGLGVLAGLCGAAAAQTLAPPLANLEKVLDRYQTIEKQGGWAALPDGGILRTGSSGAAVAALRKRLAATGDFAGSEANSPAFDDRLAAAVMAFQSRHGLYPDGIVGPRTRAAMNVPVAARIRQIAANLERLKSLPAAAGKRTILVNVAAASLQVIEENRIAFTSPVAIGQLSRLTPVISRTVGGIVVNPYWDIPRSVAVTDILPKAQRDPAYLSAQSIHVYQADDSARIEVPYDLINWKSLNSKNFPYILMQDPGPANGLGRVAFFLSDDREVFLHAPPAQELSGRELRTVSAGYIRVARALELAEFLLRRDGLASFRAMAEALQKRETRQIDLKPPVPLNIVYLTAWADPDGRAQFRVDDDTPGRAAR